MNTIFSTPARQGASPRSWTSRLVSGLKQCWMAYMTWRIKQAAAIVQPWSASDCTFRGL